MWRGGWIPCGALLRILRLLARTSSRPAERFAPPPHLLSPDPPRLPAPASLPPSRLPAPPCALIEHRRFARRCSAESALPRCSTLTRFGACWDIICPKRWACRADVDSWASVTREAWRADGDVWASAGGLDEGSNGLVAYQDAHLTARFVPLLRQGARTGRLREPHRPGCQGGWRVANVRCSDDSEACGGGRLRGAGGELVARAAGCQGGTVGAMAVTWV